VQWLWIGAWVIIGGVVVATWPDKKISKVISNSARPK